MAITDAANLATILGKLERKRDLEKENSPSTQVEVKKGRIANLIAKVFRSNKEKKKKEEKPTRRPTVGIQIYHLYSLLKHTNLFFFFCLVSVKFLFFYLTSYNLYPSNFNVLQ